MESNVLEIFAQYGVMGGLLFAVMHWLVRYYLPQNAAQHREELTRIIESHNTSTNRLVSAIERNNRVVQFNSQALLVQSFIRGGVSTEQAQEIASQIRLSAFHHNGVAAQQPTAGGE